MRRTLSLLSRSRGLAVQNLIQINNGTFYREHPSAHAQGSPSANPPLFPNLNFELPTIIAEENEPVSHDDHHWAVIGPSDGTTFLEILRGSHLCFPPSARSYPYLASEWIDDRKDHRLRIPSRAIQYVGFNSGQGQIGTSGGVTGAYLSARYESRREETDWSVLQYLKGETELNPSKPAGEDGKVDMQSLDKVIEDLHLQKLLDMPVSNLSNGQTRRARIAKALLGRPKLVLLDEPFMGLDPPTLVTLSPMLRSLARRASPLLLFGLRPQDPIPDWLTHLVVLGPNHTVALQGESRNVLFSLRRWAELVPTSSSRRPHESDLVRKIIHKYGHPPSGIGDILSPKGISRHAVLAQEVTPELETEWREAIKTRQGQRSQQAEDLDDLLLLASESQNFHHPSSKSSSASASTSVSSSTTRTLGASLIDLQTVRVKYGSKTVLGHGTGLTLSIRQGTRLALLGPNGSGKTTLLSLLTSDHPQSYSLPISFFGRSRLPSPGIPGLSLWEIQSRIGHSAPEVHAFFPKYLPIRRVLESSWAETYAGKPTLTPERNARVDAFLRFWQPELQQDGSSDDVVAWASDRNTHAFGTLPFSAQRLLLLLRAIIKEPDIIILDEAFSGLSAETRDKAMAFLEHGLSASASASTSASASKSNSNSNSDGAQSKIFGGLNPNQALVVVSHVKEEIPPVVDEWLRLPGEEEVIEHGRGVEGGRTERGYIRTGEGWMKVWGIQV
ncbi:hypothetical protein H2202_003317 [Exophiala xenobiotica]|nr:hypothetical protein H2202_003317 [Exophiala xenobiotica]KAK5210803.1 hypothetical protein LTR41_003415 [Exophiala xenobiotica]KAK5224868.1 hypothetical protein LTR72_004649 [Exophiala xenobiotica]KAK5237257.1 hypothetical protein LTR47_001523 [Exophiala xenobiotica]KAK5249204.1 hypothetical protein LTS06_005858 [Exophiala xenobiotica]